MFSEEIFMTICGSKGTVQYHKTATEAALACGFNKWDCARPASTINRLQPGDEMCMNGDDSVFRLSGRDIDYVDIR